MKKLFISVCFALFCATVHAQTIRTLGYNSTNGQIVVATNVVWTNAFSVSTNTVAQQIRENLGLGATNNVAFNQITALQLNTQDGGLVIHDPAQDQAIVTFQFDGLPVSLNQSYWNNSNVRSAFGLPLAALTNTSNVTMMRALAGSTNTSHPFTGPVTVVDDVSDVAILIFSNGILVEVQFP